MGRKPGVCFTQEDALFFRQRMKQLEEENPNWSAYGVFDEALAELQEDKARFGKDLSCYTLENVGTAYRFGYIDATQSAEKEVDTRLIGTGEKTDEMRDKFERRVKKGAEVE